MMKAAAAGLIVLSALALLAPPSRGQAGFSDSLRRYSDHHTVPFQIGTAVTLQGGPTLYPPNGYQPGLLSNSPQDEAFQALVRGQFNQIEPGNELKMMSVWTGGATRVNGHDVADTNLTDPHGPLAQLCAWAEAQRPRLTVRGHCMIYNQGYTLPHFPPGQPPLFDRAASGAITLNSAYTPQDLRDMMESYVRQVVDATLAQNAASRARFHYKVVQMWDVTNEVVNDDPHAPELPGAGFAYKNDDPWYRCGPPGANGAGYDYVNDIYRWADDEMTHAVGQTVDGRKISKADRFELYYNDYSLEWNGGKTTEALNMIRHIRQGGGRVDGLGFQAHIDANGLNVKQFDADIAAAITAQLRFAVTELDCAIHEHPSATQPSVVDQEINQGNEMGEVTALCVKYGKSCDCLQIWGATDDGSWIPNGEATPITRWVTDTRPGPTRGQEGYWPKEGQYDPATLFDPATRALDPNSGHVISNAYDQMLTALKTKTRK